MARESALWRAIRKPGETRPAQGQDDRDLRGRSFGAELRRGRDARSRRPRHPFGSETSRPLVHAAPGETAHERGRFDA